MQTIVNQLQGIGVIHNIISMPMVFFCHYKFLKT